MCRLKKTLLWFVTGLGLGYLIVHPSIMMIARLMASSEPPLATLQHQSAGAAILTAFSYRMLPWGLGVALLSGMVTVLVLKMRRARVEKAKFEGVLELAGAACHELNQPMQVILGYADLIGKDLSPGDALRGDLEKIISQISRMNKILKKIRAITRYRTFEYINGVQIIDIDKASEQNGLSG